MNWCSLEIKLCICVMFFFCWKKFFLAQNVKQRKYSMLDATTMRSENQFYQFILCVWLFFVIELGSFPINTHLLYHNSNFSIEYIHRLQCNSHCFFGLFQSSTYHNPIQPILWIEKMRDRRTRRLDRSEKENINWLQTCIPTRSRKKTERLK